MPKGLASSVARHLRLHPPPTDEDGTLPGVRVLAKTLGVSVPTVCKALRLLEKEQFLEAGGDRRKWRLTNSPSTLPLTPSPSPVRPISGKLLFLTPQPLGGERFSGVEVFASLLDRLAPSGWEVMYRVQKFTEAKNPRRSWDQLLAVMNPQAIVVLGGTPVLATWAARQKCRTLFLGGDPGDTGLPVIAVKLAQMLEEAATRLLAMGHRRIMLPLCARQTSIVEKCRRVAAALSGPGRKSENPLLIVETGYMGPEVIVNLLRRQWKKAVPDAVIFLDWREFVAASSFFNQVGIVIPRDLSVIILSQNTAIEWHVPPISHFEHPVKMISRIIARWVVDEKTEGNPGTLTEVKALWNERQSVIARSTAVKVPGKPR
ncbi:substrate-binding domain-containing protein [Luteolibacter sp.]